MPIWLHGLLRANQNVSSNNPNGKAIEIVIIVSIATAYPIPPLNPLSACASIESKRIQNIAGEGGKMVVFLLPYIFQHNASHQRRGSAAFDRMC